MDMPPLLINGEDKVARGQRSEPEQGQRWKARCTWVYGNTAQYIKEVRLPVRETITLTGLIVVNPKFCLVKRNVPSTLTDPA
jgi:hypothetical protein